ncbi:MAG: two component transcriptional regulator, winged helix family [Anaerocolumna sp.]|nr:two component transcriptional regulator, winged helix family [Anaerocolumna sp.]
MYKVLIVEDDKTIAELLKGNLNSWGFDTHCVSDFNHIMDDFINIQPHLVLLDISLPFYNGYYWCSEIRKVSKVPIIFLSSHTENLDIVMAMNMGGDDYITKPFSLDIVIVKMQAILRRTYTYYTDTQVMTVGDVILNLNDSTLLYQGEAIELTKNEYRILTMLMNHKNTIVSRDDIMKHLWDSESFIDDNTLTVNINRLRKKLEDKGIKEWIQTKKGMGYMIRD